MAQQFSEAFLVFNEEGDTGSLYESVTILDNGWVEADVTMDDGSVTTAYFSPNKIDRVYQP